MHCIANAIAHSCDNQLWRQSLIMSDWSSSMSQTNCVTIYLSFFVAFVFFFVFASESKNVSPVHVVLILSIMSLLVDPPFTFILGMKLVDAQVGSLIFSCSTGCSQLKVRSCQQKLIKMVEWKMKKGLLKTKHFKKYPNEWSSGWKAGGSFDTEHIVPRCHSCSSFCLRGSKYEEPFIFPPVIGWYARASSILSTKDSSVFVSVSLHNNDVV